MLGDENYYTFLAGRALAANLIDGVLFGFGTPQEPAVEVVGPLVSLVTFLPMLAVGWRRLHDTGRPGWYLLVPMLISLATFVGLMLGVVGFAGLERAGADPEALTAAAAELGIAGIAVALVVQLACTLLILWWLTRPTEPVDNRYGPVPQ